MNAGWLAAGAIVLWASLAALSVALAALPPLFVTGVALLVGSAVSLPAGLRGGRFDARALVAPPRALALGVAGLFGYHALLFAALRLAPPVEANLVNYLWPLFIVVLAPLVVPGARLRGRHVVAAVLGFGGAALAIVGGGGGGGEGGGEGGGGATVDAGAAPWGYLAALAAALVWGLYSLATKRLAAVPTATLGSALLVSGLLALAAHAAFEPAVSVSAHDVPLLVAIGLGPLGAAFFLWDAALKRGDPAVIGLLSFATPVLSTTALLVVRGQWPSWHIALAAAVIVGAALLGTRRSR